jgi:hypothetical protein
MIFENFLKTESHTRKFRVFESNFESDTKNFRVPSRESGFLLETGIKTGFFRILVYGYIVHY